MYLEPEYEVPQSFNKYEKEYIHTKKLALAFACFFVSGDSF